jgi:hypothetical protein
MRSMILLFLTVALATPHAQRQDQEKTQLGGIELTLGMPQDDVLRKLGIVYHITYNDSVGEWSVMRNGDPLYRLVGTVAFRNERLISVSKEWGPGLENRTAAALATALLQAVQSIAGQDSRLCLVSVEPFGSSDVAQTVITCGRRRLSVLGSPSGIASVTELLSNVP